MSHSFAYTFYGWLVGEKPEDYVKKAEGQIETYSHLEQTRGLTREEKEHFEQWQEVRDDGKRAISVDGKRKND